MFNTRSSDRKPKNSTNQAVESFLLVEVVILQ